MTDPRTPPALSNATPPLVRSVTRLDVSVDAHWDNCEHQWRFAGGSAAEMIPMGYTAVKCNICGVPGDLNDQTGELIWPTT